MGEKRQIPPPFYKWECDRYKYLNARSYVNNVFNLTNIIPRSKKNNNTFLSINFFLDWWQITHNNGWYYVPKVPLFQTFDCGSSSFSFFFSTFSRNLPHQSCTFCLSDFFFFFLVLETILFSELISQCMKLHELQNAEHYSRSEAMTKPRRGKRKSNWTDYNWEKVGELSSLCICTLRRSPKQPW